MAQAPTEFTEFVFERDSSPLMPGGLVVGHDGFIWVADGVIGEAHQRCDWIVRSRCAQAPRQAELVVRGTLRWLQSLDPADRARAGLAWVARWHWLWNGGALEGVDDDTLGANLPFLVEEDFAELIEASLWWTSWAGLPVDILEDMVLWASSALFDRSTIWPRASVVGHVRQAFDRGCSVTKELIDALELLLAAERRQPSQTRGDPENVALEITALLDRFNPTTRPRRAADHEEPVFDAPTAASIVRIIEALEGLRPLTHREWAALLLDPLPVSLRDLRRAMLSHLDHETALDTPTIRAALAGARASVLAMDLDTSDTSVFDDLRDALGRTN